MHFNSLFNFLFFVLFIFWPFGQETLRCLREADKGRAKPPKKPRRENKSIRAKAPKFFLRK
jgi:hypothetical protein